MDAYADDIAMGSKDITKLQRTINDIEKWCSKHEFEINVENTEMMAFRQHQQKSSSTEEKETLQKIINA